MGDVSLSDFLRRLSAALDAADIPGMVVGSLASSIHGQPRSTKDIDLVVQMQPADALKLASLLDPELYDFDIEMARDAIRRRSMFNVIDMGSSWKADIIIPKNTRHARAEFPRRVQLQFDGAPLWCASAEDTLLGKLRWARESGSARQLEDASGIIPLQGDLLDKPYIEGWVAELELQEQWAEALRQG